MLAVVIMRLGASTQEPRPGVERLSAAAGVLLQGGGQASRAPLAAAVAEQPGTAAAAQTADETRAGHVFTVRNSKSSCIHCPAASATAGTRDIAPLAAIRQRSGLVDW